MSKIVKSASIKYKNRPSKQIQAADRSQNVKPFDKYLPVFGAELIHPEGVNMIENISCETSIGERIDEEYRRGFEEGIINAERAMREDYENQFVEEKQKLEKFMQNILTQFGILASKTEAGVLKFSIAIAEKILKREVEVDEEFILPQIREAVKRITGVEAITLRINPADEELVRNNRGTIHSTSDNIREFNIETDEKIDRGSCVIESAAGNIDARVSAQLNKLEDIILNNSMLR